MTRTERAIFPRAVLKDRSESRTGLDKSIRKHGAGPHNWGRLEDERDLEEAAFEDEQFDEEEDLDDRSSTSGSPERVNKSAVRRGNSLTDEEVNTAKQFRKNILKGNNVTLSAIARSSAAVSTSPPNNRSIPIAAAAETRFDTSAI